MNTKTTPKFFLPMAPGEMSDEEGLSELARFAGCPVPPEGQRVYSITYKHNGEVWTSTVGETSRGTGWKTIGRGRNKREREIPLSDPCIVLAIFPGNPYTIVTDNGIRKRRASNWANPFIMGANSISTVVLFST